MFYPIIKNDNYYLGYTAYENKCHVLDNPYPPYTQEYKDWNNGWFAAFEFWTRI